MHGYSRREESPLATRWPFLQMPLWCNIINSATASHVSSAMGLAGVHVFAGGASWASAAFGHGTVSKEEQGELSQQVLTSASSPNPTLRAKEHNLARAIRKESIREETLAFLKETRDANSYLLENDSRRRQENVPLWQNSAPLCRRKASLKRAYWRW